LWRAQNVRWKRLKHVFHYPCLADSFTHARLDSSPPTCRMPQPECMRAVFQSAYVVATKRSPLLPLFCLFSPSFPSFFILLYGSALHALHPAWPWDSDWFPNLKPFPTPSSPFLVRGKDGDVNSAKLGWAFTELHVRGSGVSGQLAFGGSVVPCHDTRNTSPREGGLRGSLLISMLDSGSSFTHIYLPSASLRACSRADTCGVYSSMAAFSA
jgi:hypothetical protein